MIINHLADIQSSRDRQHHWHDRTTAIQSYLKRYESTLLGVVHEVELEVLFVLFEGCDIHLIPLALASFEASTCGPVKWDSVGTRIGVTHTDVCGQVLTSSHTDVYPFAIDSSKNVALDTYSHFLLSSHFECLLYCASDRASKSSLHGEFCVGAIAIDHVEVVCIVTRCYEILAKHLIYMFTSGEVEFLVKSQDRSVAYEAIVFARRRRKYHYLFYCECQRLVCSKLEENVILFHHIEEYTTKLVLLFAILSDNPVFLNNRTSRAVKTHVKRYVSSSSTLVGNNELELVARSLNLAKVQDKPFLTSFY